MIRAALLALALAGTAFAQAGSAGDRGHLRTPCLGLEYGNYEYENYDWDTIDRAMCSVLAEQCFECADLEGCDICPQVQACDICPQVTDCNATGCIPDDQPCQTNLQCCGAHCMGTGFCEPCVPVGGDCIGSTDCCTGLCDESMLCVAETTTTSTTTTSSSTSTSTTGASSTTSTSSSTSTSTSLAVDGFLYFPYPGSASFTNLPGANSLLCAVYEVPATVNATTIAAGFTGTGNCGVAVYENDTAGAQLAEHTDTCPNPGILSATVSAYTLAAGALYRFCVCADTGGTTYLQLQAKEVSQLADAFTVAVGVGSNSCTAGNPPATTGTLSAPTPYPPMPLVGVE